MLRQPRSIRLPARRHVLLAAALVVLPLLVALTLTPLLLGAGLKHMTPNVWNDQVGYWTRISSFRTVGFNTGYFAPDELLPQISASRFGVGGPFFVTFYGALTILLPWGPHATPFLNAVLVGLALGLFALIVRPDRRQTLVLIALVLTAWPMFLYLPTSSQEPFNVAIAIVLAICFVLLLTGPPPSRRMYVAIGAILFLCALQRFSWGLLFIPFAVLSTRGRRWPWTVGAIAVALVVIYGILALQGALAPPGQNAILDRLRLLRTSPWEGIRSVAEIGWANFRSMVKPHTVGVYEILDVNDRTGWSRAATLAQSYAILALIAVGVFSLARNAYRRSRVDPVTAFNVFNLVSITLACVFLYLPLGYYRILSLHLLLTTLVLVATRRLALVAVVIGLNLVVLPGFLDLYRSWKPNFHIPESTLVAQRDSVGRVLKYQRGAPTPWCNTLLLDVGMYDYRILAIPPGFGVSYYLSALQRPIKSRWVLDAAPDPAFERAVGITTLKPYADTLVGRIYENPRTLCSRKSGG